MTRRNSQGFSHFTGATAPFLIGNAGLGAPGGKVFFVNSNTGSAARNRERPWFNEIDGETGFDNLQAAIDACVDSRGDVIYVARGSETVTETVAFNKLGISVIGQTWGMNPYARGEYTALVADAGFTDGPVATITASCFIYGMGFASRDAGALFFSGAAALIGVPAAIGPFGVHMKACRFPKWGLTNRIGLSIEGSSNTLIEECDFEGAFASGIYIQGTAGHIQIRNNHFCLMTNAITFGEFSDVGVNSQLLMGPGNVTVSPTKFLNTNNKDGLGTVYGNFFGTAHGASTFDVDVTNMETGGWSCVGNEYKTENPGPTA